MLGTTVNLYPGGAVVLLFRNPTPVRILPCRLAQANSSLALAALLMGSQEPPIAADFTFDIGFSKSVELAGTERSCI